MLRTRSQIRVTREGQKLTSRAGNPVSVRRNGVLSKQETASPYNNSLTGGNNSSSVNVLPQGSQLFDTMLSGLIGENESSNYRFYRDIYSYDSIGGSAVDLMSTMPFSDFSLQGCEDKSRTSVYTSAVEALNLKTLFPEISVDYLVTGSFTATPIYKASAKKFVDLIAWRAEDCDVTPTPFLGLDPYIKVNPDSEMRMFLSSNEEHFSNMRQRLNSTMLDALNEGQVELDALTTIFVPRKTYTTSHRGTSFFKRLLPIYLIEKSLFRGTLVEAGRRQRAALHLQMGDDIWDPSPEEMQAIVSLFQQADQDPLGAIVGTRSAVTPAEFRCLSGSTIVQTRSGLARLDELVEARPSKPTSIDVDFSVKGFDGKMHRVSQWHYQGQKPVYRIYTGNNAYLDCTENHKSLSLGSCGELTLIAAKNMTKDTILCMDTSGPVNIKKPSPIKHDRSVETRPVNADLTIPETIDEDLAYVLGLIISEGYVHTNGVSITNTDKRIIDKFYRIFEKSFGRCEVSDSYSLLGTRRARKSTGKFYSVDGKFKHQCSAGINSREVVAFLRTLGIKPAAELRTTRSPSYNKSIPKLIFKSLPEIKAAFMAGFIDGDGSVISKSLGSGTRKGCEIRFYSTSHKILKGFQTLVSELGVNAHREIVDGPGRLSLSASQSCLLYAHIEPFLIKKIKGLATVREYGFGIPASVFVPLLQERTLGHVTSKSAMGGTYFLNDANKEIFVEGGWSTLFRHFTHADSIMHYDRQESYAEHLSIIKRVSAKLYKNMMQLFRLRYRFVMVKGKKLLGVQRTYDLSMKDTSNPLFVANGLITKNSGGDFWKWTDMTEITQTMKMRAMGISESFLSGDANYNSMEISLSVFVENLRAYRNMVTQKIFYGKLFPLIAYSNGFIKKGAKIDEKAGFGSITLKHNLNDATMLDMPIVHWQKALRPEADQAYLEVLGALKDHNVPVGIATWAAAGGMTMEQILKGAEEEKEFRAQLKQITGDSGATNQDEENAHLEMSRVAGALFNRRRRSVLSRKFEYEYTATTRTGQPKMVHDQARHRDAQYDALVKASRELSKDGGHSRVLDTVRSRLGRVPTIY